MSFKAMQWVLEQEDVKFPDRFVLFILAYRDNHDDPHGCYPSFNRMAKDTGLSRREIIYSIQRLVKSGKLKSESRKKTDGTDSSNYYTFPQVWNVVENSHRGVVHGVHREGAPRRKGVVHGVHPNLLKRTVKEPSRSALSLPPDEQKQFQGKFLAEMKRIAEAKGL